MSIRPQLLRLAGSLGISTTLDRPVDREHYRWDGASLTLDDLSDSSLAHEIGHWIVAARARRRCPEYGLGISPDGGKTTPRKLGNPGAVREEEQASLLGIFIERELGGDWKGTARDHSWDMVTDAKDARRLAETPAGRMIRRRGLVDEALRPAVFAMLEERAS